MKHYLVLMATLASQSPTGAFANQMTAAAAPQQVVVANTTQLQNAAQLENAAQAIVLPPTATQELRQMNTTNEPAAAVPAVVAPAQVVTAENKVTNNVTAVSTAVAAPVAAMTLASAGAVHTDAVPAVTMPVAGSVSVGGNGVGNSNGLPATVSGQPLTASVTATETIPSATQIETTAVAPLPVEAPNLTEHALMAFGAVVGLGIFGVTLVRLKKRGALGFGKSDRAQMEIISQMTLTPKRKIILVRIRDQEIALASTEHGITMLTEVSSAKPTRQSLAASAAEPRLVGPARSETKAREVAQETAVSAKKTESFLNALKNIKTKAQQNEVNPAQDNEEGDAPKTKVSPTLGQTRGAFPKYLANAFQQEGNRKVNPKTASTTNSSDEENLENVTNMIREKLKNIHQAG